MRLAAPELKIALQYEGSPDELRQIIEALGGPPDAAGMFELESARRALRSSTLRGDPDAAGIRQAKINVIRMRDNQAAQARLRAIQAQAKAERAARYNSDLTWQKRQGEEDAKLQARDVARKDFMEYVDPKTLKEREFDRCNVLLGQAQRLRLAREAELDRQYEQAQAPPALSEQAERYFDGDGNEISEPSLALTEVSK